MLELNSSSFSNGGTIPDKYTREHGNVLPAFDWHGAPEDTQSYALIVEDPDAPAGTVRHLAISAIGRDERGLAEGQPLDRFTVCRNVFGEADWGGPRPPAGHGPHHYHFKLLALDVPSLPVEQGADAADLVRAIEGHVVAEAEIVGIYENTDKPGAEPETNTVVRLDRFGGPDAMRLAPAEVPEPHDDAVLVRVVAASVNPVDAKTREGKFPPVSADKLPIVLGRDLAGTIARMGPHADPSWYKGDAVFAHIGVDRGAQARYVVVKANELVRAPESLDPVHAAAIPLAAMTAWQGLFDHGGLKAGQRVLIHGGAGGVGHLAIQFAKAKGATVFATAGADDLEFVRHLGADTAIDYKNERFEDVARDIDVVFDLIGGDTQERSWAVLREGGIMVSTLAAPDPAKAEAHKARAAPHWMAQPNAAQLREVAKLVDAGKVRVTVAETYPFERVAEAQVRLEKGHVRGKIVLTLGGGKNSTGD